MTSPLSGPAHPKERNAPGFMVGITIITLGILQEILGRGWGCNGDTSLIHYGIVGMSSVYLLTKRVAILTQMTLYTYIFITIVNKKKTKGIRGYNGFQNTITQ